MSKIAIKEDYQYKQYVHLLGNAIEEYPLCEVVGMLVTAIENEQDKYTDETSKYKNYQLVIESLEAIMQLTELCVIANTSAARIYDHAVLKEAISKIKVMS